MGREQRSAGIIIVDTASIWNENVLMWEKLCWILGKCEAKDCPYRHTKQCKWLNIKLGWKRAAECDYLHVSLASDEKSVSYKFEGCKDIWVDVNCVVGAYFKGQNVLFLSQL